MDHILDLVDVSELTTRVVAFAPRLGSAFVFFLGFWFLYRLTRIPIEAALRRVGMHDTIINLLVRNVYRYTVLIFGAVMALDQLGVNIGAALAGLGVAGIAIGFAAQDSVANVISGFLILWDKPFEVGDWLRVDGQFGRVAEITLRTTRLQTNQNTWVVLPNKSIVDAVLENLSKNGETRIDIPIGIAYKENVEAARTAILPVLNDIDVVRERPAPDVVVVELGDSSVNLLMRVWVDDPGTEPAVRARALEGAKRALDDAGIEIPFPHLQLFLDEVRSPVWKDLREFVAARGRGGE
ncbi:MAG: mechanosensitive ion channel family protein [bacterium]